MARKFRRSPTGAEARLWNELRRKRILGFKFRRQQALGRFVVDFYCRDANLVIEVDGPVHNRQLEEDSVRQATLEKLGLRVLRFGNDEIHTSMVEVLDAIAAALPTK